MLDGHKSNICVVDAMYYADKRATASESSLITHLASASVDSTVRIWTRHSDFNLKGTFELDQVITAKLNGFALCLKFYVLPLSKCSSNVFETSF